MVNYPAANFQLTRLSESKIVISISFGNVERDIVKHEFQLAADVKWPPRWERNHDTMAVIIIFYYLFNNCFLNNIFVFIEKIHFVFQGIFVLKGASTYYLTQNI